MTGLLRLVFVGLMLWGSVVGAKQLDHLSSHSWIHAQSLKVSSDVIQLVHTIHDDGFNAAPINQPSELYAGSTNQHSPPPIAGGITLAGPAHRLNNFHQTSWKISGCGNHGHPQTVLAYCTGKNPKVDCGGIFLGGTKNTIITLPVGCGVSPFARVASFKHTNRRLPRSEERKIGHNKFAVFKLKFDYNFKAIPHKKEETPTQIHMEFSNLRGYTNSSDYGMVRSYPEWLVSIGLLTAQDKRTVHLSKDFSANLADLSQKCDGYNMNLDISVRGKVEGKVTFGYYFSGTIIPPVITDHYLYLDADAKAKADLTLSGLAKYSFKGVNIPILNPIKLLRVGYPGIFEIGPYFEVLAGLKGDVAVDGTVTTRTGFSIPTVSVSFGNGSSPITAHKATNFASVTLSENLQVSAGLTVYLAPQAGLRLNVLGDLVNADVALRPSAGITTGGRASVRAKHKVTHKGIKAKSRKIRDPCMEIAGSLDLYWLAEGKLATWGKSVKGRIWGVRKKLWGKCWKILPKKKKHRRSHVRWEHVHGHAAPQVRAVALDGMTCPSIPPFSDQ